MVDWDLAVRSARGSPARAPRSPGTRPPRWSPSSAPDADRSTGLVRDFTGLVADAGTSGTAPVLVVDRPGWIHANTESFDILLSPVVDKLTEKKGPPTGIGLAVGSRSPAPRSAAVLGFLAGKVLGQFDPFIDPAGRLLLVAPNIVHVEREIDADPQRLPALGLPARGDPPGAVHRGPVDARPPVRPGRPTRRHRRAARRLLDDGLKGSPRRSAAAAAAACSRCSARPSSARSWTASPA